MARKERDKKRLLWRSLIPEMGHGRRYHMNVYAREIILESHVMKMDQDEVQCMTCLKMDIMIYMYLYINIYGYRVVPHTMMD